MESIVESFERLSRERPSALCLWSRGEGLRSSFSEVAEHRDRWRRLLGAQRGEPVALALGNVAAFVELVLALWSLDCPVLILDASLRADERSEQCRRLGIGLLIDGEERPGSERLAEKVWLCRPGARELARLHPGTVLVKMTSGSTGEPLGACFSAETLLHGIRQIGEGMDISARDRVLVVIPLSHSYGFDNGILSLAVLGTPLILEPSYFPGPQLRALKESEATVFPLVPPLVRTLGESAWPEELALRRAICAGGVLSTEAASRFQRAAGRPVHDFYGSTETGGICFERRPLEEGAGGSVGHPLPGVEVDLDAAGRVRVTSRANLLGYLGRESWQGPVKMGDHALWGDDGRLRLIGRSADILNIGGRKVPAARIEEALIGLDGVRQAAAVGVADPVRGDRVVAFVVSDRWPVTREELPVGLAPRKILRIDTLPFSARGKLDRARLRTLAVEQLANSGAMTSPSLVQEGHPSGRR